MARLEDDARLYIEIQSQDDPRMAKRMLHYLVVIMRRYGTTKMIQTVLYVGNKEYHIKPYLELENLTFSFQILDIVRVD